MCLLRSFEKEDWTEDSVKEGFGLEPMLLPFSN